MKSIVVSIAGTTGSVKHYVPLPDKGGRLVGIEAVVNTTQTGTTSKVIAGKMGVTNKLFEAKLGTDGANGIGLVAKGAALPAATKAERNAVFGGASVPVELDILTSVVGVVGIVIYYDEYLIDSVG
jgi:hypothetical protein